MNSQPPTPVLGAPKPPARRLGLVLLAVTLFSVALIALAAHWTLKHRADKARALAERRQVQWGQEEMLRRMARAPVPAGPIRSGPVRTQGQEKPSPVAGVGGDGAERSAAEAPSLHGPEYVTSTGELPVAGGVGATGAVGSGNGKGRKNRGEDLFDACVVPRLVIEVPRAGVVALRANPRRYVVATVHEGALIYTNVALKLKGGPGSFRPFEDTPSLTLNFEKLAEGQSFHGLKKLHLNSSVQDRSFLCEKISRELFNAAGVPTPRAGHAILTLNGRELGLHVLVEGVNRQFLKRHFTDPGGNVYDGHSGMDVGGRILVCEGENPGDRAGLAALAAAAKEPDLAVRQARLEAALDVDRFLTFVALETILVHWDGYTMSRNNFRIFHDRSADRLVFMPHGMDQVLGRRDVALFPKSQAMVARSVLEVPDFRVRYRSRLGELATNVFRRDVIAGRVREISTRVGSILATEDATGAAAFRRRASSFERRVLERSLELERQLFGAQLTGARGTNAPGAIMEWQPRLDLGDATLERVQHERGRSVLRVSTSEGCTASWRSHAVLEPGRYRLEGDVRTKGVELDAADPRAGAGFRVSRYREGQKNSGDREWKAVRFEFEVGAPGSDVELICELRARKGVVWFDPGSIKLTRL